MRIHPPDLADLFPSSGRRGISFLEMLILSIKKRLCSFLVERRNDDEVSQSFTPHLSYCAYFFPTFFCSYSLFPSSRIFLPTSFLFSYAPAICFPPWADICCQAALLFCSSHFWLEFYRSLSFSPSWSLSLSLSLSSSVPPSGPPPQTSHSNNVSIPPLSLTFFIPLPHSIQHNLIQSISHHPIFHYTSHFSQFLSCLTLFLKVSFLRPSRPSLPLSPFSP